MNLTTTLSRPLRGIIPPLATPLLDRDTLDKAAVGRMIEGMLAAGVSGIFLLGTTSEAPGLSHRLRREIVDHVCSLVAGRIPVLVGITDTAMVETVQFAAHAAKAGASALVLAPPYYFPMSQPELLRYLERLTPELPLPVYLYNIPSLAKTHYAPDTVRAAADLGNVYGIKDSSGDVGYFSELVKKLADRPEFSLLCGPEELFVEAMKLGAHGGVLGGSNLFPELYVELYQASVKGDEKRIAELQTVVLEISKRVYHASADASGYLRGMKCALWVLGRCRNVLAEPFEPYGPIEAAAIRNALL